MEAPHPNREQQANAVVGDLLLELGYGAVPRDASLRSVEARLALVPRCDRTACIPLEGADRALSVEVHGRLVRSIERAVDMLEGKMARGICEGFLAYDVEDRVSRNGLFSELLLRFEFRCSHRKV